MYIHTTQAQMLQLTKAYATTYKGTEQSIFHATNHRIIFEHATKAKHNRDSRIQITEDRFLVY